MLEVMVKANGVCIENKNAFCNHGCHKNIFKQKHFSQIIAWDNTEDEMLCAMSKNGFKRSEVLVKANG